MLLAALLIGLVATADDEPKPPDVTEPPAAETFWVVPLRVHVLGAPDLPELDCALTDDDVRRIVGKANRVWQPAGVHFGLESIVREPAERLDQFAEARGEAGPGRTPLGLYRIVLPEASREFDGLHVYYLHKFSVNGVYLGDGVAIVQETAALRPVEGGIDEPLPRVTAHELGHALGLPHRQDRTNLLASGTTGTLLNAAEVERVRSRIATVAGARSVPDLRRAVEDADDDPDRARRLRDWLAEIPGAADDIPQSEPPPVEVPSASTSSRE